MTICSFAQLLIKLGQVFLKGTALPLIGQHSRHELRVLIFYKKKMKRAVYLCAIFLCSISFAFAQGVKPRRTSTNSKNVVRKTEASTFAEAERAWGIFFPKFSQAVRNRDYESLKTMMVKDVRCDFVKINNNDDTRDECLADWKKTSENQSYIHWKDVTKLPTTKPSKFYKGQPIFGYSNLIYRLINLDYPGQGEHPGRRVETVAHFAFIKDSWLLIGFSS